MTDKVPDTVSLPESERDEPLIVPSVEVPVTDNVPPTVAFEATDKIPVPVKERFALFNVKGEVTDPPVPSCPFASISAIDLLALPDVIPVIPAINAAVCDVPIRVVFASEADAAFALI